MSARDLVETDLRKGIPKKWKLIPAQGNIDTPSETTLLLKLMSLTNSKEAPKAAYEFTFVVTIVEPGQDILRVERVLDDHVEDLWQAIEAVSHLNPEKAEKVALGDLIAYDITFTALYKKEA